MTDGRTADRAVVAAAAAAAVALVGGAIAIAIAGYDRTAHAAIVFAGKSHQAAAFGTTYFTPRIFTIGVVALAALGAAAGAPAYAFARHPPLVRRLRAAGVEIAIEPARRAIERLRRLQASTKACVALILALQLAFAVVRAIRFPVSYDEAWTFLNFTSRSILASLAYYPAPNNHILFSELTNVSRVLPLPPLLDMRVVSIVVSALTVVVVFVVALRYFDERVALLGTALLAFSYPLSLYAVQARGYGLLVALFAVCFGSALAAIAGPARRVPLLCWYAAASILGFYTMPSFLYAFASVNVAAALEVWRARDWRLAGSWLAADAIVAAATCALYAPVFLVSGVRAVTSNSDVARLPMHAIVSAIGPHLASTANWLSGVDRGGLAVVLVLAAAGSWIGAHRPERTARILWQASLVTVLAPPAIMLVHRAQPFERTWIYLVVPLTFFAMFVLDSARRQFTALKPLSPPILAALIVGVAVLSIRPFDRRYRHDYDRDFEAEALFGGFPASFAGTIEYDDVYFADQLTYRMQLGRHDAVVARRLGSATVPTADALVLSADTARPLRPAYRLWRTDGRLTVYVRARPALGSTSSARD